MRPNKSSKAFYSLDLKFPNITSIILVCSRLPSSLNPDSREGGLGSTFGHAEWHVSTDRDEDGGVHL